MSEEIAHMNEIIIRVVNVDGKRHTEKKTYIAERTSFESFNPRMVEKIKGDIAKKNGISVENVDLSKFFHIRTTLSISRHRDIVEQEMSSFLQKQYPRITVESAKTVFGAMMELLTRCQSYEALDKNALFTEVRKKKGVSKSDFSRIIEESMYIDVPPFQEIDTCMGYSNDEKMKAALEYTKLLSDVQRKEESFSALYRQIRCACKEKSREDEEPARGYCDRIYNTLPIKNPIYSKTYIDVLVVSILINEWRMAV